MFILWFIEEWHVAVGENQKSKTRMPLFFPMFLLLFEGTMQHLFDLTILVLIAPEEQIDRLMARNAVCREDAEKRLNCQMPIREKIAPGGYCD